MMRKMKVMRVCCQGCGADLEVDESVRFVTCNYCHAKLEIVHDTSVTHTRLMEKIEQTTDRMAGNLRVIELQNDLERLDREWEVRRESFMQTSKNGRRYIPSVAGSVISGVIFSIVGVVMLGIAASARGAGLLGFVGLGVVALGVWAAISGSSKANAYRREEDAYGVERNQLIARIESSRER